MNAYEVYAIKYASVDRVRQSNFLAPVDGDPAARMPLDFFVWLIRGHGQLLLVDTGFSQVSAIARQRNFLLSPIDSLQRLGVQPDDIRHIAITHLHYDHAGNMHLFPKARIWLQQREIAYATGQCMCDAKQNHFFALDDIGVLLKRLYAGEVSLIDGDHEFAPGIDFHRVGGHTDGLQVVSVMTAKGRVVLASDAAHYYENLQQRNPFPAIHSREDMLAGYDRIEALAGSAELIIPGHDPLVCERHERVSAPDTHIYRIA